MVMARRGVDLRLSTVRKRPVKAPRPSVSYPLRVDPRLHEQAHQELLDCTARRRPATIDQLRRGGDRFWPGWWVRPVAGDRRVAAGPEGGRRPPAGPALKVRRETPHERNDRLAGLALSAGVGIH